MSLHKEVFTGSQQAGLSEVKVGLLFHKTIDYNRSALKKALRSGAAQVIKDAKRLVSRKAARGGKASQRKAFSQPGESPLRQTGALKKSIGVVKRASKEGYIVVGPRSFSKAGIDKEFFYPATLFYGRGSYRPMAPRENYMARALQARREQVRAAIQSALRNSLVPR